MIVDEIWVNWLYFLYIWICGGGEDLFIVIFCAEVVLISERYSVLVVVESWFVKDFANWGEFGFVDWDHGSVVGHFVVSFLLLAHLGDEGGVEPLCPEEVGLAGMLFQMPPPSLLEEFLHENAVITFLNVGSEDGLNVFYWYEIGGIDNLSELFPDDSKVLETSFLADFFYGDKLFKCYFWWFTGFRSEFDVGSVVPTSTANSVIGDFGELGAKLGLFSFAQSELSGVVGLSSAVGFFPLGSFWEGLQ